MSGHVVAMAYAGQHDVHMDTLRETGHAAVHLRAWGATDADIEQAVQAAGRSPSRSGWEFTSVERLRGAVCPLDVRATGGGVIAADAGYGWAYVAILARDAA